MKFDYKSILSLTVGMLCSCVTAQASLDDLEDEVALAPTVEESFEAIYTQIQSEEEAKAAYDVLLGERHEDKY